MKKALKYILSVIIWFFWWIIAIISISTAIFISIFIPKKFYNQLAQLTAVILLYSAFIFPKVKYDFQGSLPFPVIFVANHVSFFDLFVCCTVLPGFPRGIQLKEHFSKPIYGWVITRFGEIPIDVSSMASIKNSFKEAIKILDNKVRNILIMPEGKRTITGKIGAFKSGAFFLSKKANIPIVPVVFKKLFERNNRTNILINPGKFEAVLLAPVYPKDFKSEIEMTEKVKQIMEKELNS